MRGQKSLRGLARSSGDEVVRERLEGIPAPRLRELSRAAEVLADALDALDRIASAIEEVGGAGNNIEGMGVGAFVRMLYRNGLEVEVRRRPEPSNPVEAGPAEERESR